MLLLCMLFAVSEHCAFDLNRPAWRWKNVALRAKQDTLLVRAPSKALSVCLHQSLC